MFGGFRTFLIENVCVCVCVRILPAKVEQGNFWEVRKLFSVVLVIAKVRLTFWAWFQG